MRRSCCYLGSAFGLLDARRKTAQSLHPYPENLAINCEILFESERVMAVVVLFLLGLFLLVFGNAALKLGGCLLKAIALFLLFNGCASLFG